MKLIILAFLIIVFVNASGCVYKTQDISPVQIFRLRGSEEIWHISGNLDSRFKEGLIQNSTSRTLNIFINGQLVIKGSLTSDGNGELIGKYRDHNIISYCSSEVKTATWLDIRCMILVDNERAATLTF